eukprot:6751185-Prymnesium_polylepis.1
MLALALGLEGALTLALGLEGATISERAEQQRAPEQQSRLSEGPDESCPPLDSRDPRVNRPIKFRPSRRTSTSGMRGDEGEADVA